MSMYASSSVNVADSNRVYQPQEGSNNSLFLLKGCLYQVQIEDLLKYSQHEVIGKEGTYGTSYKWSTQHGPIVIKRLVNLQTTTTKSGEEDWAFQQRMEEIGAIGYHPNVKLPFGYYCSPGDKFLLYEYAAGGTFKTLLKKSKAIQSTATYWQTRLDITLGVAKGIAHIHSKPGLVHGNIKSSNVTIAQDQTGCISDFGFSPLMDSHLSAPSLKKLKIMKFPVVPELEKTKVATQQVDVYNLGLMLVETVPSFDYSLNWHPILRLEMEDFGRIGGECLNKDPDKRPTIDEVVRRIQNVKRV